MECERKYTVYMHRNRFNDKKYFGITCRPVDERWKNGLGYKKNSHFYNSILKHGWDEGFDHVILAVGLDEECAKGIERLLIAVFNTQNPKFGYNVAAGGDTGPMHTPETIAKQREKLSIHISNPNSNYNKSKPKRKKALQQAIGIKVVCSETGVVFNSLTDAAKSVGLSSSSLISRCCKNKNFTAAGYHWQYDSSLKDIEFRSNFGRNNGKKATKNKMKAVLCVETGVVYPSQKDAIVSLNLPPCCSISQCCRGKKATAGGYHWEYADETLKHKYKKYSVQPRKKKILCVETGVIYDSVEEAMVSVGLKAADCIFMCCRGKAGSAGGYHWEFADKISKNKYISYEYKRKYKKVLCVETKIIYNSLKEAGIVNGVNASDISACCRGKQKTAGGYHWEYA